MNSSDQNYTIPESIKKLPIEEFLQAARQFTESKVHEIDLLLLKKPGK